MDISAKRFLSGHSLEEDLRTRPWLIPVVAAIILLAGVFLGGIELVSGDLESGRSTLGILAGVFGPIIVLVLTIPLIPLQAAAIRYGSSIYEIFYDQQTFSLLILLIASGVSPIIGLFILNNSNLNQVLGSVIVLTIMMISFIPVYIWDIKEKLRAENLVDRNARLAIEEMQKGNLERAEKGVDVIFTISGRTIMTGESATFHHCLLSMLEIWRVRPRLSIHDHLVRTLASQFELACSRDQMIVRGGVETLINKATQTDESGERAFSIAAIELIDALFSNLPPETCEDLRSYSIELLGSLGRKVSQDDPELSLRIIDALAGSIGIIGASQYSASRAIRWILLIFERLESPEALFHITDIFDGLLAPSVLEIEWETEERLIEGFYNLFRILLFDIDRTESVEMLEYILPRLPSSPRQDLVAFLAILGGYTVEESRLKEMQPLVASKLNRYAEISRIDRKRYLSSIFTIARRMAGRMEIDLESVSEFEDYMMKETIE